MTLALMAALTPVLTSSPVRVDADDPALWIHPTDGAKSFVVGTDKDDTNGALHVWDMNGKEISRFSGLKGPNNVDVQQGFRVTGGTMDLVVTTERHAGRLRIFRISMDGKLLDVSGITPVFKGETGGAGEPMGIALYRRPDNGQVYAFVGRKTGPRTEHLHMYRLVRRGDLIDAEFVRALGEFSGTEIESLVVDDEAGVLYAAEEGAGIRAYPASPDREPKLLAFFARTGYQGDREGLAVVNTPRGRFLLSTDQTPTTSRLFVYKVGTIASWITPEFRGAVPMTADSTDGIEAIWRPLGPKFPNGVVLMMDSTPKRFAYFDTKAVLAGAGIY